MCTYKGSSADGHPQRCPRVCWRSCWWARRSTGESPDRGSRRHAPKVLSRPEPLATGLDVVGWLSDHGCLARRVRDSQDPEQRDRLAVGVAVVRAGGPEADRVQRAGVILPQNGGSWSAGTPIEVRLGRHTHSSKDAIHVRTFSVRPLQFIAELLQCRI